MEIRGAGDILGRRQHGHIGDVGFDLYTRLLAQAVRELGGESELNVLPQETAYLMPLREAVQINLPIPVHLPGNYANDVDLRLRLYRRMAGLVEMSQVDELEIELADRFGPLPPPAANLIYQLRLKVLARAARVRGISTEGEKLVIQMENLEKRNRADLKTRLEQIVQDTIVGRRQIWLSMDGKENWRQKLIKILSVLKAE